MDQSGLPRTGHACDADHQTKGNTDINSFKIMLVGIADGNPPRRGPVRFDRKKGDSIPQVFGSDGVLFFYKGLEISFKNDMASLSSCSGTEIDD